MTEDLLNNADVGALLDQEGGRRVSRVMHSGAPYSGLPEESSVRSIGPPNRVVKTRPLSMRQMWWTG